MHFLLFLLVLVLPLAAQQATLAVTILDPAGLPIPDAALTLRNEDTGVDRRVATNIAGQVLIAPLQPGRYTITAEKEGFQPIRRTGLEFQVQQTARLNLTMNVGAVAERVDVTAAEAPVLTESISVESTVDRNQIQTLPLNSRDFNQLVLLAAGATENINSGSGRDFGGVALNGNRAFSNDYLLDGLPNNDIYQGRSAIPVSIDLIGEFKVTSAVARAEHGQAGAQISVVSRSGTNRFRGSIFEFYRGTTGQARNPFNTAPIQPFSRHQFGGSFGGPIVKNRAFFFLNYEGNLQRETQTRVATVPLDAYWRGDFSALLARGIQLRDPLTAGRPVIPNNRLDQYLGGARVSKFVQQLQPFWGSPTESGLFVNNAIRNVLETTNSKQFTAKGDYRVTDAHQVSLRYSGSLLANFGPSVLATGAGLDRPTNNHNGSLAFNSTFSPRLLNEFRFGGQHYDSVTAYSAGGLPTVDSLNWKGFEKADNLIPPLPRIQFTGLDAPTQLNYGTSVNFGMASLVRRSTTYTMNDNVTWIAGRHSIKTGFELRRTIWPALQQTNARGALNFRAANTGLSSGYVFADLLMSLPSSTTEVALKGPVTLYQSEMSTFIQDDWRITSRLTLSYGLRHELYLNPVEEKNRIALFDPKIGGIVVASDNGRMPTEEFLPSVVSKLTGGTGKWPFPLLTDVEAGLNPRSLVETRYTYFAPRVGFSWQPTVSRRNVVRGGYGTFYTRYPRQYLQQTAFVTPPFAGTFNYNQAARADGTPLLTAEQPFPTSGGTATVSPIGMQRDFGLPLNHQWNLTVEREIGWQTVASIGYVGNRGVNLFRSVNANAPRLDSSGNIVRPFSSVFGTTAINYRLTDGNSIYHSLLIEARRRISKGLTFQGNFTWAKGIDDTGVTVNNALLDVQNLGRDRANSDYVRRHQVTINSTYELPIGRGRAIGTEMNRGWDALLGGWRLAGIWRLTTGRYFTPEFTAQGGLSNNRPDVVAGAQANLPSNQRSRNRWFNAAAFREVPAIDLSTAQPRFGNAGRNILLGPGLNTTDASLAKSFPVFGEGRVFTFRVEAFNVFNNVNYDQPAANISNTNQVGTITNIVVPMRQLQFAFRFDF